LFLAFWTLSSWAAHRRHHASSLPAYDARNIVVHFIYLLRGARCFHVLLCAARPSHIAGNSIGEAGCIALSSSLVHLSHLERLYLYGKFGWWSRVFVAMVVFACYFVLLFWVGYGCEKRGFDCIGEVI
jgi:hypothetical protein